MVGDWASGDLVQVTRSHHFGNDNASVMISEPIPEGTVVLAVDPKPTSIKTPLFRVLHEDSIWVANANYVKRVYPAQQFEPCTTANQETY